MLDVTFGESVDAGLFNGFREAVVGALREQRELTEAITGCEIGGNELAAIGREMIELDASRLNEKESTPGLSGAVENPSGGAGEPGDRAFQLVELLGWERAEKLIVRKKRPFLAGRFLR